MGVINKLKAVSLQKGKADAAVSRAAAEKYSKLEDCPAPSDQNFGEWMKYQKQNWRKIRRTFKENKDVVPVQKMQQLDGGLGAFMKNMDEIVLKSTWHLISINQETADSGIMKVWVQNESRNMFAVKIKMPRIIYINSKKENDDSDFRKVNSKILPRNRKIYNLYEWETEEEVFQEKLNQIMYDHLLNPDVEGVYETKMPLKFRAINELGCMLKPRQGRIPAAGGGRALARTYCLNELEGKSHLASE
jgi:DNA polymerase epsilon subunit 1